MIALLRRFDVGAQVALLAMLAAYFMVWPVWRAGFPIEIAQNEGWNAYHADAAMGSAPLYPATDTLIVNNYPPLSFYVVGEIAKATGIDALYVGRVMSLIAVISRCSGPRMLCETTIALTTMAVRNPSATSATRR